MVSCFFFGGFRWFQVASGGFRWFPNTFAVTNQWYSVDSQQLLFITVSWHISSRCHDRDDYPSAIVHPGQVKKHSRLLPMNSKAEKHTGLMFILISTGVLPSLNHTIAIAFEINILQINIAISQKSCPSDRLISVEARRCWCQYANEE